MAIHPRTIYSKTPKGVLEVKNRTAKLDRTSNNVFQAVDGKSTVADLVKKTDIEEKKLHEVLEKLTNDGFLRVVSAPAEAAAPAAKASAPAAAAAGADDDFDFTTPEAMAKLNAEAEARAKAEAQAKARALAAARSE